MADDTWLDDDEPDTEEAELADRMHVSGDRWRKLAVFAVVMALLIYATITWLQRRDDREEEADAEERHHQEGIDPAVTTTFASGEELVPVEPSCPEEPYSERAVQFTGAPPTCIDEGVTYVATVETSRGDFEITLDGDAAPQAVNNFVYLARWRYYEDVAFYQVVPGLAIDAGDPVGPVAGQGDPGYTLDAEPPDGEPPYPTLSVRMVASSETGSIAGVFSIVTGATGETLPAGDSLIGHVTDGEDVVRAIEETGNQDTGVPQDLTVIERIVVDER